MTYFIDILVSGESLETFSEKKLKYNIQNNDISEIKDRQASYSNVYDVPKTPKNKRLLGALSLPSDTSSVPYTKPECQLKISGFSFILKGWINVKDADDSYKIYIYSGIIDFFKSLENKTIGDILGSDLDHIKDLPTVINSFTNETYRYLIADYNGVTHYNDGSDNIINIDYLVPSARVQYIWEKIHTFSRATFSGSIFASEAFTNLWLTYPKAISTADLEPPVSDASGLIQTVLLGHRGVKAYDKLFFTAGTGILNNFYFKAPKTARYNVKVKIDMALLPFPFNYSFSWTDFILYYTLNQENIPPDQRANKVEIYRTSLGQGWETGSGGALEMPGEAEFTFIVDMNGGDEMSFISYIDTNQGWNFVSAFEMEIAAYIPGGGSFSEELKSLEAVDFFKEVLNQLGLTPYTQEDSSEIRYKTIKERLVDAPVLDWSDKYINRKGESYVHSSYAQNNRFKYQYNDKEADFNNGGLLINNPNLSAYKDVFVSKTYSPDKDLNNFYIGSAGSRLINVFRIYDKNLKENSDGTAEIEYKGLDKRFHFVRSEAVSTSVKIGSQLFEDSTLVNSIPLASFARLDWDTVLQDNYLEMGRIMNDSRLHEINLKLNPIDVIFFDLFCLIYFTQEQQYYLVNKLSYTGSPIASGSFVRVKRETDPSAQFYILISWGDDTTDDKTGTAPNQSVKLVSITPPAQNIVAFYEWEINPGSGFVSLGAGVTPKNIDFPASGIYEIRYKSTVDGMIYYSNVLRYNKTNADIYITDFVYNISAGTSSYKLHVENQPFVGYVNLTAFKKEDTRNASIVDEFGGKLTIKNTDSAMTDYFKSTAVVIPVGVYDCQMSASCIQENQYRDAGVDGSVGYGLTPNYYESIETAQAGVRLEIPAQSESEPEN